MSNSIAQRIADFLEKFAPFRLINETTLLALSQEVTIVYKEKGEVIFDQGESAHLYFYIIKEGAVLLSRKEGAEHLLVDTCDEGDLFGLRPLLADQTYALKATADENTLLYGISIEHFKPIMASEAAVSLYLARNFASGIHIPYENAYRNAHFFHPKQKEGTDLTEIQELRNRRPPVTCLQEASIQQAASVMQQERVSSILIIDDRGFPMGIITDKDLRNQVATGIMAVSDPVTQIMSAPVFTIPNGLSVAEVQMAMIKNKIHHLAITEDGTDQSPLVGVLTEHDLLVAQANNPAALLRKIKHSYTLETLRDVRDRAEDLLQKYLDQGVKIKFIAEVMSQINDALIQRIIQMSLDGMLKAGYKAPNVSFCWLSLGSEGREEQLLRTDQDNALVFDNVEAHQLENTRQFFLSLAQKVTQGLNACGFEFCPAEMMASNPKWCLSLQEWKNQFKKWMVTPTQDAILMSTIFFDFRPVHGNEKLADALTSYIFEHIDQQTPFLNFLAKDAVHNPPHLGFFRNFVVEKNGEHKDTFDIKARAMMPLTDAARLLTLAAKKDRTTNTPERFRALALLEKSNAQLFEQAADAYEVLMEYRTKFGLRNEDSGRFINPEQLSKMERLQLRNSFKPISELQTLLSTRYNLAFLM